MLLLGCLSIIPAAAQRNLSGIVCDSNGEPLIGATVSVEGRKGLGAVTDLSGKYQLRLPEKHQTYILKVRFVGYVTESRSISPQDRTADFRLKEDAIGMETVVVTGTRTPKRLKEVPVITRVITLDDIRKQMLPTLSMFLKWKCRPLKHHIQWTCSHHSTFRGSAGMPYCFWSMENVWQAKP